MPAPASIEEFLALAQNSQVLERSALLSYLQKLRAAGQPSPAPAELATQLLRVGLLSHFQAAQLLQGKWRGFVLGPYCVLEQLGAGGMGCVYLGQHTQTRRLVALKVLPVKLAKDPATLQRFFREGRAGAALEHRNIVHTYDLEHEENLYFLVMDFVDGTGLQEIVKRHGPLSVTRAAHYIRQAALGLQHAHEAGLIHRDIKPGNLLLDRYGTIKILDMGLARFLDDHTDNLTRRYNETVLGTADYFSPEQAIDSHRVDIRGDIYSLGATFYFLLTGHAPFEEANMVQKLLWHQIKQPKPITTYRSDVPDGVQAILQRMMAKAPGQRFQVPAEVAQALTPWTSTPIPIPAAAEMPILSPLVQRILQSQAKSTRPASASAESSGKPDAVARPKPSKPVLALPSVRPATGAKQSALGDPRGWYPRPLVVAGFVGVGILGVGIFSLILMVGSSTQAKVEVSRLPHSRPTSRDIQQVLLPSSPVPNKPGLLKASAGPPPPVTDLTSEGILDWGHWGLGGSDKFNRKRDVPQYISNYIRIGSGRYGEYGNNANLFRWKDGAPVLNSEPIGVGVFVGGTGNGFEFAVPADTTPKTLRIYVGLYKATGKLEASLSDRSAVPYSLSYPTNRAGSTTGMYTIHFKTSATGQKLTVKYTQSEDFGSGNVTLQAATLASAPAEIK